MDLFTFLSLAGAAAEAVHSTNRDDWTTRPPAPAPNRGVQELRTALDDLRSRTDRLALVNMALWSLLRDRLNLSEQDLEKRIEEIDLSDGTRDGRVTRPPTKCSRCSRMVSRRHDKCLYCGAARTDFSPFDRTG